MMNTQQPIGTQTGTGMMNTGMNQPMNTGMNQPMNTGMNQPQMNTGMNQPMNTGMMNTGMNQPLMNKGGMGMRTENITGPISQPDPVGDVRLAQQQHKLNEGHLRKQEALAGKAARQHGREEALHGMAANKLMHDQQHHMNAQDYHQRGVNQYAGSMNPLHQRAALRHAQELERHQAVGNMRGQQIDARAQMQQNAGAMRQDAQLQKQDAQLMKQEERQARGGSTMMGGVKDVAHKAKAALTGKP